jgi:hypothetical protein
MLNNVRTRVFAVTGHVKRLLSCSIKVLQSKTNIKIYVDEARRCQRLLRILCHCQVNDHRFLELYYQTIEQSILSQNKKIIVVALGHIATHLFEISTKDCDEQRTRLVNYSSTKGLTTSLYTVLHTIQAYRSRIRDNDDTSMKLFYNHIGSLYPYTARFLDVRRQFRDCTQYFIDGDSLLLSTIYHSNVCLTSSIGHTIHVIFMIERFLLKLFAQAPQLNYTLIFFDCHMQFNDEKTSILALLRACLIAHLKHNTRQWGSVAVRQFSSWLSDEYLEFARHERPMFIFYHDLSSFTVDKTDILSSDILERLTIIYRLFGNYHQYTLQCQLYLMNKIFMSDTVIECFHVQFNRLFPSSLLKHYLPDQDCNDRSILSLNTDEIKLFEQIAEDTTDNDLRLVLYMKTLRDMLNNMKCDQLLMSCLGSLLVLHIALLVRLSIMDRRVPSVGSSFTLSPQLNQQLAQFQQILGKHLVSYTSSTLSWSKIADLFDGRLFMFTIQWIHQSTSTIRIDSQTNHIVQRCLSNLNLDYHETYFVDIVKQLIQSNHIVFSTMTNKQSMVNNAQRQQVIRISNPLTNVYLKSILPSSKRSTHYDMIDPNEKHCISYPGIKEIH